MILFWIKEAFKAIGRAKSSFILSLMSMSISVLLILTSFILIRISDLLQTSIKNKININIFLNEEISDKELTDIKAAINEKNYFKSLDYISKEKAAEIFIKETGEDFRKILDYNPLPASFSAIISERFAHPDSIKKIVTFVNKIQGVDEVIYEYDYINRLLNFLSEMKNYVFIITGVLFLLSIYIVYSTVKLVTNSKTEELETMKLVGAKLSTIKAPIILNGMLIGFFAGIVSLVIFSLLVYYFDNYIDIKKFLNVQNSYYLAALIAIGPLVGFFVSYISLRKISLKI